MAPLSMEFPRQEYWSGLPFPTPKDLSDTGIETGFVSPLPLVGGFFTSGPPGKPHIHTLLLFSHPVMSDSLQPHGLQHVRPPYLSPSPRVCPSSCPLLQWGHLAISSHDALLSFCPRSFPVSGTFPMSWLFTSDDQNTGASASILPMSIQGWFSLRLTGLISAQFRGLSGVFSSSTVWRHQFFGILPSSWSSSYNPTWSQRRP